MGRLRDLLRAAKTSPQMWFPRRRTRELDYSYQDGLLKNVPDHGVVLDLGSGARPFPRATLLAERFLGSTPHRAQERAVKDRRPLLVVDVHNLPFADDSIDYVYCAHVLEHVEDPLRACREIMRVGKAGYIETPTRMKDVLFSWAEEIQHRWHVVRCGNRLVFFEYDAVTRRGLGCDLWRRSILSRWYHPNQDLYFPNQHLFNTCFEWTEGFEVSVFWLDGREAR